MNYNYQHKIVFSLDEPFDIDYINTICNQYPNAKILVEVQNTKEISSDMIRRLKSNVLIRIAGGYDNERISRFGKDLHWSSNYYHDAVIYTKNETIKILEEMERIESGLNDNWSDIQKLLYIYDRLKRNIMYDPKYEHKLSNEIRSLRGLITKQTVCAGYAIILKEFMDRIGIECEYVEGHTKIDDNGQRSGAHAWNIVIIDGKKYPIDLTWDNAIFRSGKSKSFDWLGKDISAFSESHHPAPGEKTQYYEHTLSQIDPQLIKQIYSQMGIARARDYRTTTYYGTRKDGSKFIVAQIGDKRINNTNYYRYYYVDISKDGKRQKPLILYSETNVTHLINCKNFGKYVPQNYEEAVDNILFSRENIADSLAKNTYYIGRVRKNEDGNKFELVSSYQEIPKPMEKRDLFVYPTKVFTRSDGSVFIAQQMLKTPLRINNIDVMQYDIFEMVNENGEVTLKSNTVFTERNFFRDTRQGMIDDYLSRERLDRKVAEAGGYIGYYDEDGRRTYYRDLVQYFETSKKVDIDSSNNNQQIPDFNELKSLALNYDLLIDSNDASKLKIRDIKTGQIQTDKSLIDKAIFANIWLVAAGVKYCSDEERPGFYYAFNEASEKLYYTICEQLITSCKNKKVIDTIDLLKNIEKHSVYKYNKEIIVNLFRTQYQTEFINTLFLQSLGINQQIQSPEPLYSMSYAGRLMYGNDNKPSKER